jgi:hypothetical protein
MKMAEQMYQDGESARRTRKFADRLAALMGAAATPLAFGVLSTLAGCTAILDISREQCQTETDCANAFPDLPYTCVENVCELPLCDADQDCRQRGGRFASSICDLEKHQCAPAECLAIDGCGQGRVCNLATNRCQERECSITADCLTATKESPTVECIQGYCVDPQWGCIGQPDDRQHVPGEKGTLEFQLLSGSTNTPIVGADWDIRVCGAAQYDIVGCDESSRPPGWKHVYDSVTGTVTISGLDPELPVRIWIDEKNLLDPNSLTGKAIIPMEFVTQKPPVGLTKAPPVRVVAWSGLAALIASYGTGSPDSPNIGTLIDRTKASLYSVAFDCQDRPAANVKPSYSYVSGSSGMTGPITQGVLIFYFDEAGIAYSAPSPLVTNNASPVEWTFPTGVFSTLNLPASANMSIMTELVVRPGRLRTIREKFSSRLTLGRMTTVHFYPRNYAIKTAQ